MRGSPFRSYFLGGFECSTHKRSDGQRVDVLRATAHDVHAASDYAQLLAHGIRSAREGLRWHLIEREPGVYDWSSAAEMARAARVYGMQVVWDLCHYGWPDDLDVWSPAFVERFAAFAAAAAVFLRDVTGEPPWLCPINEMSFFAWRGGECGHWAPHATGRGAALKRQLVSASIAAIKAVRRVVHGARFISAEPLIYVHGGDERSRADARAYTLAQYEALDMVLGFAAPELGGSPDLIDVVGLNYYPDNQWFLGGPTVYFGHHGYVPFHELLLETFVRYRKPLLISETGSEGSSRPAWLHYVCDEVATARQGGADIVGICLYPVLDYPGWEDDRPCQVGLLRSVGAACTRAVYMPLAQELERQTRLHASAAPSAAMAV